MSVRTIHDLTFHINSFRNIQLWFQGIYCIRIQTYIHTKTSTNDDQKILAHPYAHTDIIRSDSPINEELSAQMVKCSSVDDQSSVFNSKCFMVRYLDEEVLINDICHFRIEADLQSEPTVLCIEVSLLFWQNPLKSVKISSAVNDAPKVVKTNIYKLSNLGENVNELLPVTFDGQYFSLANLTLHGICFDYRYRATSIQLSDFARLSALEKSKLIERNQQTAKRKPKQKYPYFNSCTLQLHLAKTPQSLQLIQKNTLDSIKRRYLTLFKEYNRLYSQCPQAGQLRLLTDPVLFRLDNLLTDHLESRKIINLINEKSYSSEYQDYGHYETLLEKVFAEIHNISEVMLQLYHCLIAIVKAEPKIAMLHYQNQCFDNQAELMSKLLSRFSRVGSDMMLAHDSQSEQQHLKLVAVKSSLHPKSHLQVQDYSVRREMFPTVVEEVYTSRKDSHAVRGDGRGHLIVLAHGFQGNSNDMKGIKNSISLMYPSAVLLCSTSNEQNTNTDIIEMGSRLASEIKELIIETIPLASLRRISFIGHSLGGLIIRAALPRLMDYSLKFHTFISLSSPHLGYRINTSAVVEAGLWFLQRMKNSYCLKQLNLTDSDDIRETCLYRLSELDSLRHFQNIVLIGSKQDSYAPYESARIEIHSEFISSTSNAAVKETHCQMVRNLLGQVAAEQLTRIDVQFRIDQTNLDSLIGRTAHIMFLENYDLMKILLHSHKHWFN